MTINIELLILIILSIFQSIFGIGLLFIGTPIFLTLGYSFVGTLEILLPISICISFLQFFFSDFENKKFVYDFNKFCLPFLIFFSFLIVKNFITFDFKLITSFLVILFSIINLIQIYFKYKIIINKFSNKIIFLIIGSVHGLTNLGGPLLSVTSSAINENKKEETRYCISYGYFMMGTIQLLIIFIFNREEYNFNNFKYILIPILIYFPSQNIFKNINQKKFIVYINFFAFIIVIYIFFTNF